MTIQDIIIAVILVILCITFMIFIIAGIFRDGNCSNTKCKNKQCERNQIHLTEWIIGNYPISIAEFKDCKEREE